MKGSLIVVAFFCVGCLIGAANEFRFSTHNVFITIEQPKLIRNIRV